MQDKYVNKQAIYVNMQLIYIIYIYKFLNVCPFD